MKIFAALLIEDFSLFEFGVICEVFGMDRADDDAPLIELRVVGEQAGVPIRSSIGVYVTANFTLDTLADADLVALPAYTVRDEYPPDVLDALRAAVERGAILLSVCTGAFLLGAAGLLDGRPCTTHWRFTDLFAGRFPAAELDPDVLFVDDGNIITSAGTAAGIDACLHLVRREFGSNAAIAIAHRMVVPLQRDGGQRQYIELPMPACDADNVAPVLTWMLDHLTEEHTVAALARHALMSERTFARRFGAETGSTPHRWLTMQRVLHARQLLEETQLSIDEVAQQCGFGTGALLRHHFHRLVGAGPSDYRRVFSRHWA